MQNLSNNSSQTWYSEEKINQITNWLKTETGKEQVLNVQKHISDAQKHINEMIIVSPHKLKEPYTL